MSDQPPSGRMPAPPSPTSAEAELGPALRALGAALLVLLRRAGTTLQRRLSAAAAALWLWLEALRRRAAAAAETWRARRRAAASAAMPAKTALVRQPPPGRPTVRIRSRRAPQTERRPRLRARFRVLLWTSTALVVACAGFLFYCAYTLPLSGSQRMQLPPPAMLFENDGGKEFAARGIFKGQQLTPDHLPKKLVDAVVAIEDRRFFEHPGVDLWGIARAAVRDLVTGSEEQGASTITQQLARRLYLSPERSIIRKVQEAMLAVWLESHLGKREILARYLNTAYFGAGAYGADAAAKRYFGKDVQSLDLTQSAMLAGLIRAPTALAPTTNLAAARRRADTVLDAMVKAHFITAAEMAQARAHPATLVMPPQTEPGSNYFVDTAGAETQQLLGVPLADLTVRTTLDPALQTAAERTVAHWLATEGRRKHAGQAALVALAPDGKVLALVGGRDYDKSQFNRATQAHRQPGSLFKIFVYLAAFSNGYTPDSVVVDQPVDINGWQPRDYERHYEGPVTLTTAFAQSINTVSAQLVQQLGVKRVIDLAHGLGVKSELPAVPSLALGTAGVTLMEMTAAMDAIAVGTKQIVPYTVESVAANGKTPLYTRAQLQVQTPSWNRLPMMKVLQAVVNEGTGTAARLDRPVGGKTGTSSDFRDAWFVGFTTDFVVGVWVGNDDNSPMKHVVGGDIPAKIWHDFVQQAERIKAKRGPATPAVAEASAAPQGTDGQGTDGQPAAAAAEDGAEAAVEGVPLVVDTGTLLFKGRLVHLFGVEGEGGHFARDMARYIGGRPVTCEPADGNAAQFRCRVGNFDLAEAVVYNGGGRAAPDAPAALRSAEEKARLGERGVWGR